MKRTPMRFKRLAEAFRSESSSGSEHSAEDESFADLSDLVNSFLDIQGGSRDDGLGLIDCEKEVAKSDSDSNNGCDSDTKDLLKSLFEYDDVKLNIHGEAEKACLVLGNNSSPDFKRRLMTRLRDCGFDAGLCKSKWEKSGRIPSGDYEYIDINVNGTRYIIEVFLAGEFEIARPTRRYTSLLELIPHIFVGKVEELKQVVRLLCNGVKKSMKSTEMHVPPWRRYGYVQAKWFGSYKRTINEISAIKMGSEYCHEKYSVKKRSVGFVPLPLPLPVTYTLNYCREDFGSKLGVGLKVGNLAAAMNGTTTLL